MPLAAGTEPPTGILGRIRKGRGREGEPGPEGVRLERGRAGGEDRR
jgi:hypothetical protein